MAVRVVEAGCLRVGHRRGLWRRGMLFVRSCLLQRCYGFDKGSHEVGRGNSSPPAAGRKSVPR